METLDPNKRRLLIAPGDDAEDLMFSGHDVNGDKVVEATVLTDDRHLIELESQEQDSQEES